MAALLRGLGVQEDPGGFLTDSPRHSKGRFTLSARSLDVWRSAFATNNPQTFSTGYCGMNVLIFRTG